MNEKVKEHFCFDCHRKIGEMPRALEYVRFIVRCPHCETLNIIEILADASLPIARIGDKP